MGRLVVELNGTDVNPYHRMGLTQNPFPQTGKMELDRDALRLQSLGGDPIADTDHIRRVLDGFSPEFVDLCCRKFKRGEYVTFEVTWEDA